MGGSTQILYCKIGSGARGLINREGFTNTMYTLCANFIHISCNYVTQNWCSRPLVYRRRIRFNSTPRNMEKLWKHVVFVESILALPQEQEKRVAKLAQDKLGAYWFFNSWYLTCTRIIMYLQSPKSMDLQFVNLLIHILNNFYIYIYIHFQPFDGCHPGWTPFGSRFAAVRWLRIVDL